MIEAAIILLGVTALLVAHYLFNRPERNGKTAVLLAARDFSGGNRPLDRLQEECQKQGLPPLENPDLP